MTRYEPRHGKPVSNTGPIIVTATAAIVAAVPGVALTQSPPPPVPKPAPITQPQPAITVSSNMPIRRLQITKGQERRVITETKRVPHRAPRSTVAPGRSAQSHPKPVRTPTVHLYGNLSQSQLAALWVRAGGNPAYAHIASAVAMAESSGRQYAHSGTSDFGYWQINGSWGRLATYDALGNAKAAILISRNGRDWSPWTTFVSGAYLKYM